MATEQALAGTPVLTNELDFDPDFQKLGQDFDFFKLSTTEKFIQGGARCLDDPQNQLKALSFTFDRGRTAFFMFFKTQKVDENLITRVIHQQKDQFSDTLSVERVIPSEIKTYILLRLYLNSISNFSGEYVFNNLSGKIFLVHNASKDMTDLETLEIGTDWMGHLSAIATNFARVTVYGQGAERLLNTEPFYSFEGNKNTLKREWDASKKESLYVRKFFRGQRPTMNFYELSDQRKKKCKVYYLYRVVNAVNSKMGDYLHKPLSFKTMTIAQEIETSRDRKFIEKVRAHFFGLAAQKINCINLLKPGEGDAVFDGLVQSLNEFFAREAASGEITPEITFKPEVDFDAANLVLHHDEIYYKKPENGGPLADAYKRLPRDRAVIQSVTLETFGNALLKKPRKGKEKNAETQKRALILTLLKEMLIKDDILHSKSITIDDWPTLEYHSDWIFAMEEEGWQYYMTVHPNGRFETRALRAGFVESLPKEFQPLANALISSTEKTKTVVADDQGNINLISSTGMFVMPKEESVGMHKNREHQQELMNGVFDINYYEKYGKGFYSVGAPHAALHFNLANATLFYQVEAIQGKIIIIDVLQTFAVNFVKLNGFTVLPYPFKYLREFALMDLYATGRWREKIEAKKKEKII
jgi:hypothetical protein